jgi:Effector-associated domain 2
MAGESGEPGKAALVDALLRIPVMQEPDGRALVLAELTERGYRLDAMRYSRDRHDIWAIISACLQQPAALAELAEVLHGIEGDHFAAAEFRRLVQAHLAGTAHPPAAPAAPQPPYSPPPRRPGPADSPDSGPDFLIRATAPEFADPAGVFPHVAHDQLTRGAQLGAGARGRVFALLGHPGLVYKEYLSAHVNGGALTELILQRAMMGADERKQLDTSTSWPLMRVMAGRQVVGSLMRALPDDFYVAADDSRRPAYLSYLCYPPRPAWSSISMPSPAERLEIARGLVDLVAFLQSHSLVIGDISAQNLLWTCTPAPHVFLLGCDAIRLDGEPSALPEGETPDWRDPLLRSAAPDFDSDNYKVALMVGRILAQEPYVRPGDDLPILEGIPQGVASGVQERFAVAAGPRGQRPAIGTWAQALRAPQAIQLRLPRNDPPDRRTVQPIYLVCDVAGPAGPAGLEYAHQLPGAMREVSWHPVAADRTRIGVVAFYPIWVTMSPCRTSARTGRYAGSAQPSP